MRSVTACCLLLLLLRCGHGLDTEDVRQLTTANFEHDTQASTGQTTGHWAVLFADPKDSSQQPWTALWDELAQSDYKTKVFAQVDSGSNEALLKRFSIQKLPAVLLFKDRKMYRYSGTGALEREDLLTFLDTDHVQQGGEAVPVPKSFWQEMMEKAREAVEAAREAAQKALERIKQLHDLVPTDPLQRYATYVAVGVFPVVLLAALLIPQNPQAAAALAAARGRPHRD